MYITLIKCNNKHLFIKEMGAGGCLGPKKAKNEIYAKLILQLHEQALKISHQETKSLDMYQLTKQKISKKGILRKLIDNLSSHRHKILDSFNLNYKLTVQTRQIQRHYAGLIIADSLIQMTSQASNYDQQKQSKAGSILKSALARDDSTKNYMNKTISDRRIDIYEQHNSHYDELYLRLAWYLFQNQKKMHNRLLQSLIIYCNKHPGTIGCQHFVWKIIQKLSKNIYNRIYLSQSCTLFNLLLQRTKDEANQQLRNQQTLSLIIRTWLKQKQSLQLQSAEIQQDCQQIIHIYFHRCISLWYCEFLYEVIFNIYDSIQWNKAQQSIIEKLLDKVLEDMELKSHFLRGLFNQLLGYLSVTHESLSNQVDKKWFSTSLGLSSQKFRAQYRNILKDSIKIYCLKLLSTWIQKNYTDINQFCMYNNQSLIFVYLSNSKYYFKNKQILDQLIDAYFIILTKLDIRNRRLFVQRLQQTLRQQRYSKMQQQLLLRLIKQCVYRKLFFQETPMYTYMYLFLTPILLRYDLQIKLEILKLTGYLFQVSPVSLEKINEEQKFKICQFLFSIYENITIMHDQLGHIYQFVCASLSVIRLLHQKFINILNVVPIDVILAVYAQKIGKDLSLVVDKQTTKVSNRYMAVYYYEEIKNILQQKDQANIKLREQLKQINKSISQQEMHQQTNKSPVYEKINNFLSTLKPKHQNTFQISLDLVKQTEQQYRAIFARTFSTPNSQISNTNKFQLNRITSRDSNSFSAYSRNSSMANKCEKCSIGKESDKTLCKCRQFKKNWRSSDYSFQEVIDIVHI